MRSAPKRNIGHFIGGKEVAGTSGRTADVYPPMTGEVTELATLATQVRDWQRPRSVSTASPFRLCFRLEEPVGASHAGRSQHRQQEVWYLRYFLQAVDDPSGEADEV